MDRAYEYGNRNDVDQFLYTQPIRSIFINIRRRNCNDCLSMGHEIINLHTLNALIRINANPV